MICTCHRSEDIYGVIQWFLGLGRWFLDLSMFETHESTGAGSPSVLRFRWCLKLPRTGSAHRSQHFWTPDPRPKTKSSKQASANRTQDRLPRTIQGWTTQPLRGTQPNHRARMGSVTWSPATVQRPNDRNSESERRQLRYVAEKPST